MEVFVDFLPSSYTVKAAPSAKEKPRKHQQGKNSNKATELAVEPNAIDTDEFSSEDRRKGDDRRKLRINRGRWLESRDRNDRRATEPAFFVKV
jgi:hypothetical protein